MPENNGTKKGIIFLTVFFVLSRVLYYLIGIRFDISPLYWFFQYIDPQLLKTELLTSILYLHTQPPVFNLFLGIVLKIFSGHELTAFTLLFQIAGLLMAMTLYILMRKFKIPQIIALAVAMFFTVSPPVILLENWLFYTYPVTFLLLASVYVLYLYFENNKTSYLLLFFSILGIIVLTRSLFHALWFIAIVMGISLFDRKNLKRIIISACLPLLIIGIVHVKNYILFKQTGLSSWFGMNMAKMTMTIPLDKIEPLAEQNKITGITMILPFQEPEKYAGFADFESKTGIRVLDQKYKSSGFINFNQPGYIEVSKHYLRDVIYLIPRYPSYYCLSVCKAFYAYLRPCSDSMIMRNYNRTVIHKWVSVYENYFTGDILSRVWQTRFTNRYGDERIIHLNLLYIYIPALFIWGLIILLKRGKPCGFTRIQSAVFAYMFFNIIYITFIGNLFEVSENMRFRFIILPLLYILLAVWFKYFFNKKKRA
jgi:hypothetical protein